MELRNPPRSVAFLLAASLLLTMGCATRRYDAYGNPYDEPHDHRHATEGAILGGLAGAGLGRAVAGHHDADAGYWIGGALGAITGAVIGGALDREHPRVDSPPYSQHLLPRREVPPPDRRGSHDLDPQDRSWGDEPWDDDLYGHEPPPRAPEPRFLNLPDEVLFAPESDRLEPGAQRRLRSVARVLREHPSTEAVIRGHASAAERSGGALSEARSRAVRGHLLRQGVAPSRVVAVGMGSSFPLASERTAEGRQRNRRAEIEIHSDRGHDLARLW